MVNKKNKTSREILNHFLASDNFHISQIFEILSDTALVTITDTDGNILYVNDYFTKVTQYSEDEILGQTHRILKSGFHKLEIYEEMWSTITRGKVWRGELKNKAKDGSFYWVSSTIAPIFDEQGKIINYIAIRFLITKEKEIEEKLIKNTQKLKKTVVKLKKQEVEYKKIKKVTLSILEDLDTEKKAIEKKIVERTAQIEAEKHKLLQVTENMNDGAILIDKDQNIIFANNKIYQMLGAERGDELNFGLIKTHFNITSIEKLFNKCLLNKSSHVSEVEVKGRVYEMFSHCLGKEKRVGEMEGCFILIADITDVKLLERSKSELVAVASHQLRTPLTAMRGNAEMLIDESFGPVNLQQKELLEDVMSSIKRLIGMVNDMLDITKIEQGKLELVNKSVSLTDITNSVVEDLRAFAESRNVLIKIDLPEQLTVYVDESRTRQVLQNLIDNAIKYSKKPGNIEITARKSANFVELVLKDDGLGIPQVEQSKIFSRFYRASNVVNSGNSGSGLGLYVVRSIVSKLGGSIFFESEEGVGTTFFVTFPVLDIKKLARYK